MRQLCIILITLITTLPALSQTELTVEYGPPGQADTWERYRIWLTPETFDVEQEVFDIAMANITSFWIRTEMHTGNDVGGIDNVKVGDRYMSNFNFDAESWSSGGDGTMAWKQSGGVEGGFLQISDWATGEWHWLIAPASWAGDWSEFKGDTIEFWYKTDQPSYSATIKLTTEPVSRLVFYTPGGQFVPPNDSLMAEIQLFPPAEQDMTISLSSSNTDCITVPSSVTVEAGSSYAEVYIRAPEGAEIGCSSVIEATASGYLLSRVTLVAEDHSSILNAGQPKQLTVYPNPSEGGFWITGMEDAQHGSMIMYDVLGNVVHRASLETLQNGRVNMANQPPGIYFVRVKTAEDVFTTKVILE
jgi:hypothetical protein